MEWVNIIVILSLSICIVSLYYQFQKGKKLDLELELFDKLDDDYYAILKDLETMENTDENKREKLEREIERRLRNYFNTLKLICVKINEGTFKINHFYRRYRYCIPWFLEMDICRNHPKFPRNAGDDYIVLTRLGWMDETYH